jgi:hypothetical protein
MSHLKSIVGNSGLISEDHYLRKIEASCLFDSANALADYQRRNLVDRRPDRPWLESDQPRRGGRFAESRIAIHDHGRRNNIEPDTEGVFLDFDHFAKDPRSIMPDPDFRRMIEDQSYPRAKFKTKWNDESNNVPESGINPYWQEMHRAHARDLLKPRYLNFEDSLDNFSTPYDIPRVRPCGMCVSTLEDGQMVDLNQLENRTRKDRTAQLSDLQLGFRQNASHRFKTAKYGDVRAPNTTSDAKWMFNRYESSYDHSTPVLYKDNQINISRRLAMTMIDLARIKKESWNGLEILFRDVQPLDPRSSAIPANLTGKAVRPTLLAEIQEEAPDAISVRGMEKALLPNPDDVGGAKHRLEKQSIDPAVARTIIEVNRKRKFLSSDEIRNEVEQSAFDSGKVVLNEQDAAPRTSAPQTDSLLIPLQSQPTYNDDLAGKKIFHYQSGFNQPPDFNLATPEAYKKASAERANAKQNTSEPALARDTELDVGFNPMEGKYHIQLAAPLGKKETRRLAVNDITSLQEVSDI